MYDIEIKNLRSEQRTLSSLRPWEVIVDRRSPLGNPYIMNNESQRDTVCIQYAALFKKNVESQDEEFMCALNGALAKLVEYKRISLFCWCAPLRCHAETIAEYLRYAVTRI